MLEILTSDDLCEIHLATLEILENIGVKVVEQKTLQMLAEAGAKVDFKEKNVKFPEYIVNEALKKAPSTFNLFGRNLGKKLKLGGKKVHFATIGTGVYVLDLETGKRRYATVNDVVLLSRLADGLENIHHVSEMVCPQDVPGSVAHAYSLVERFKNTEKPTDGYTYGESVARDTIKIASVVSGGEENLRKKPMLLGFHNPVSPLQHSEKLLEGLRVYGEYGQPVLVAPEALAGMTAPVTLSGLLVQTNAEILSGIAIAELFQPGAPVLYGNVSTVADMRTGNIAIGAVEAGLINVATAQLARHYMIPSRGTGGTTDSKISDIQTGFEQAITLIMAALARINFIYDAAGALESTKTASYEQLLIGNEICGMVSRILRGIDVNDKTLAIDVIKRVGPTGHYLSQQHTQQYFQKEHYLPKITDRESREKWEKKGSKDLWEVSHEMVKRILKEYQPEPLDKDIKKELEKLIKDIEKRALLSKTH